MLKFVESEMFNFEKAKEQARQLYHFCQILKDYSKYKCSDICTEEEERYDVFIEHIALLSDYLYANFLDFNDTLNSE